jgi:hypothetical protein
LVITHRKEVPVTLGQQFKTETPADAVTVVVIIQVEVTDITNV